MVLKIWVATEIWVTKLSAMGREYLTDEENITLRSYVSEIKANLILVFASHLVAIRRYEVDSGIMEISFNPVVVLCRSNLF